ncbi:MAG: DUF4426 domain-containing protein [Pseudomonadota bacterium]
MLCFFGVLPETLNAGHQESTEHIVYFTSIDSRLVPPLVARAHGLPRGPRYLTVSVTVQRKESSEAIPALVTGYTTNLLAQQTPLQFKEVREQDALYYLATHIADQQDTHQYQLTVEPLDTSQDTGETDESSTSKPIDVTFHYRYFTGHETIVPATPR